MTTYIIYKHTSPSGKNYVGKTKFTLEYRWKQHISNAKFGKPNALYNAIRKYGPETFTSEIILSNVSEDIVNKAERYWIEFYNGYTKGYNMTEGGEGRPFISEEQKEIIRECNRTRTLSPETIKKMSESAKRRGPASQEAYDKASRKKSIPADIYCYKTNQLLHENVYLFEWVRENPSYTKASLIKTANPNSRVKQHKGIYIKWKNKSKLSQEKN